MEIKDIIRQITEREPLNPFQIAGMAAVLRGSKTGFSDATTVQIDSLGDVLTILDRTGENAATYLIALRQDDSVVTLFPKFSRTALEEFTFITRFEGRRDAIRENLIPALHEIPNWLDVVQLLARYSMERDDESFCDHVSSVMEMVLGYLFAAIRQPFDSEASSEAEYALARLVESILKLADDKHLTGYMVYIERILEFLISGPFTYPANSLDRRMVEISGIRSALKKRDDSTKNILMAKVSRMAAQALVTALDEIKPCPSELVDKLETVVTEEPFESSERFRNGNFRKDKEGIPQPRLGRKERFSRQPSLRDRSLRTKKKLPQVLRSSVTSLIRGKQYFPFFKKSSILFR